MNIFLINHPEVYNPNNVFFGQSELPLSENFTVDFTWIADNLPSLKNADNIFYSSPFRRSSKLASFLCEEKNYIVDKRLSDLNFGSWEMKEWSEINKVQLNKWQDDFVNYKFPKGESLSEVFDRVNEFYEELLLLENENIFIVTHATVIKCFLCNVLGLSLQNVLDFEINNSSISRINFDKEHFKDKVIYINLAPSILSKP